MVGRFPEIFGNTQEGKEDTESQHGSTPCPLISNSGSKSAKTRGFALPEWVRLRATGVTPGETFADGRLYVENKNARTVLFFFFL